MKTAIILIVLVVVFYIAYKNYKKLTNKEHSDTPAGDVDDSEPIDGPPIKPRKL